MRILVLYNPISGAGRARKAGRDLVPTLVDAGYEPVLLETQLAPTRQWLDEELQDCQALIVVGGDGAVRLAADAAARTKTPIYQYPFGTENLFAREFGVDCSSERLLGALERFQVAHLDMGEVNGCAFLLMVSMGYDADVVNDLARRRKGAISHMSYLSPMLRQLIHWKPPCMDVSIDGQLLISGETGWVVIANSKQYAVRLNPAFDADMSDGLLDVVFVPFKSRWGVVSRLVNYRLGRQNRDRSAVRRQGRLVEVKCDLPHQFQLDGDPPDSNGGDDQSLVDNLRIALRPGELPVLMP